MAYVQHAGNVLVVSIACDIPKMWLSKTERGEKKPPIADLAKTTSEIS